MHEQLPLIIELVLFRGFKEEAETLFCLSDELSKDFGLCYNMITLTERGLICRAAAKGDYKTVKNLTEFYDLQEDDKTYKYIQTVPNYNGRVWEYIEGWSCEDFLKKCVERNNLVKEHLIPEEKYNILLNAIKSYQIHDCSHKNIMIEGICHLQWPNEPIFNI